MVSAKVRRLVIATAAAVEHKGHQSDADRRGNKSAQGQRHVSLRRHRLGRVAGARETGEAIVSATASPREYTRPGPPNALAHVRGGRCNGPMSGPNRRRIFGDRVRGAEVQARHARQRALKAAREADAAECHLWSEQMEGFGGPAQPSPTIAQCLNGGYRWLEVMCRRCETRASLPLEAIRRPRHTPIWKLEAALRCRSCRTPRYAPPVHMIRLTKEREIAPYVWVHPDHDR
jgi:hypothetical protein